MKTNRMKKARSLQRSAALATAALLIFTAALVCTGCPGGSGQKKPGSGGGGGSGSPPPVIGSYNAATGTLTVGSVTYMMRPIAGGSGLSLGAGAGASDNNGPHTVSLTAYHIGETEVTQELYQAVMGNNPSQFDGTSGKEPAAGEEQLKRPADTVTWFDCIDFCNKLTDGIAGLGPSERVYTVSGSGSGKTVTQDLSKKGFRLPTEAEWEWAARGSTGTVYSGSGTAAGNVAWFTGNSDSKTHQVGKKPAIPGNVHGLYDMSGNVWEWCWDLYNPAVPSGGENPTGPASGFTERTKRGGAWSTDGTACKCVYRGNTAPASPENPEHADDNIGFRIVCRP